MKKLGIGQFNHAIRLTGLSVHPVRQAGTCIYRFRDAISNEFVGEPMQSLPTWDEVASLVRAAIAARDGIEASAQ